MDKDIIKRDRLFKQWERMQRVGKTRYIIHSILIQITAFAIVFIISRRGNFTKIFQSVSTQNFIFELSIYLVVMYFMISFSWNSVKRRVLNEKKRLEDENKERDIKLEYCYHCGLEIGEGTDNCPTCGKQVK